MDIMMIYYHYYICKKQLLIIAIHVVTMAAFADKIIFSHNISYH